MTAYIGLFRRLRKSGRRPRCFVLPKDDDIKRYRRFRAICPIIALISGF